MAFIPHRKKWQAASMVTIRETMDKMYLKDYMESQLNKLEDSYTTRNQDPKRPNS